jgi:hypothetical protein
MGPSSLAIKVVVAGSTAGTGVVSVSEQEGPVKTSDNSSSDLAIAKSAFIAFILYKVLILNIYFIAHTTLTD